MTIRRVLHSMVSGNVQRILTFGLVCWKCTLVTILLRMKCII